MYEQSDALRRLEDRNATLRRYARRLFGDRSQARDEIARLHAQFTRLAEHLEASAEEWDIAGEHIAGERNASDAVREAAARIRRTLTDTP